jgi:hypothetical protein
MHRRPHRWALWLLPWLVARLFVPTGFMLSVSGAGIGIDLCPAYAPLPGPLVPTDTHDPHAMHGGAHSPDDGQQPSGNAGSGTSACPFALPGSQAGCPAVDTLGGLPRFVDAAPRSRPHPDWISPAVLIDRIRGPPFA